MISKKRKILYLGTECRSSLTVEQLFCKHRVVGSTPTCGKMMNMIHVSKICISAIWFAAEKIFPGVTTSEIDTMIERFSKLCECISAPKEISFPGFACISINKILCHGYPCSDVLKVGDVVNIDVSLKNKNGYYGDCCRSFIVGSFGIIKNTDGERFFKTYDFMLNMLPMCKKWSDIEHMIGRLSITGHRMMNEYHVGHGISTNLHEEPYLDHFTNNFSLIDDVFFTFEPIFSRIHKTVELDHFRFFNEDVCYQWENTIMRYDGFYYILTYHEKDDEFYGNLMDQ